MKIKPEHLNLLRAAVTHLDTSFHRERYKAAALSDKRYRWDLLYHAQHTDRLTLTNPHSDQPSLTHGAPTP